MKPDWVSADRTLALYRGDCVEVMRTWLDESVDAIVTDPPAGISFMGKAWDSDKGGRNKWIAWLQSVAVEMLRVIKPGGHALVWAIPRTSHWTATAFENAGWEVRDRVSHLFGVGMPKSLDVSKAIDKAAGVKRDNKFAGGITVGDAGPTGNKRCEKCGKWLVSGSPCQCPRPQDAPVTPEAARWQGWGTGLKPAIEDWWLLRKPLRDTVAKNVQKYGTGALSIDACRIGDGLGGWGGMGRYNADRATWSDETSGLKAGEARPAQGRWPANAVLSHHPDCVMLGEKQVPSTNGYSDVKDATETVGVWQCHPDCPVRMLDEQSGDDSGGASRFFFTAKASRSERDDGLEVEGEFPVTDAVKWAGNGGIAKQFRDRGWGRMRNTHSTVKPLALMEYLVKLVTPPGGLVLDPFAGSGTTLVACAKLGFRCVGIDLEPEYAKIAVARVRRAREKAGTLAPTEAKTGQQLGLLTPTEEKKP